MDLINKQVKHISYGKGIVIGHTDSHLTIQFQSGDKSFVFPDAFEKYLSIDDKSLNNTINELLHKKDTKLKQKEEAAEEERLQQLEKRKLKYQSERALKKSKINPCSQSVFWCKSDEQEMAFADWTTFTGYKKSGIYEGQVNKPIRLNDNSACLLTSRERGVLEKDRHILGVFMTTDNFVGKKCEDGYIKAHPYYRIRLSKEESDKMLFWDYYVNEKYPHAMTWESGIYRYFDNEWMARILKDIVSIKNDSKEKEHAQQFFDYFCKLNDLDKNCIPDSNGSLKRV